MKIKEIKQELKELQESGIQKVSVNGWETSIERALTFFGLIRLTKGVYVTNGNYSEI